MCNLKWPESGHWWKTNKRGSGKFLTRCHRHPSASTTLKQDFGTNKLSFHSSTSSPPIVANHKEGQCIRKKNMQKRSFNKLCFPAESQQCRDVGPSRDLRLCEGNGGGLVLLEADEEDNQDLRDEDRQPGQRDHPHRRPGLRLRLLRIRLSIYLL